MRKRSSKGGGEQRSIQVHLMVNEEEAGMIRTAAKKRNQTVSLTIIEAVKLLEGRLQVKEEERDSPTVQALKEIEYQLRRIGRNVNQIAHNANREMNATIEDEASASYAVRQCRELIDHLHRTIRERLTARTRTFPDCEPRGVLSAGDRGFPQGQGTGSPERCRSQGCRSRRWRWRFPLL